MKISKVIGVSALVMVLGAPAYAEGDPEKGKKVFRKCSACHSLAADQHILGPSLHNIVGKKAGSVEGYKYSNAFKAADLEWTEENLKGFLAKPRKFLPKNKMGFAGIKKEKDLANLISYLKTLQE